MLESKSSLTDVLDLPEEENVNVLVCYNPLDLTKRSQDKLVYQEGKNLKHYLDGLPEDVEWSVCLNDEPIDAGDWEKTVPKKDDYLVLIVVPHGGGGGKTIFRLVAMIALSIIAPGIGTALGIAAGSIGMTIFTAAFTMIGGLLLNALMPPPKPKQNDSTGSTADSPSYGIDGAKNTSAEDLPVPVVFGDFRVAGNVVNLYTTNSNDTQFLHMLMAVSEGEIAGIDEIEINDQPVTSFQAVNLEKRLGVDNQAIIGWFDETITMASVGQKLSNTAYVQYETSRAVDRIRIDLTFPQGLAIFNDKGDKLNNTVNMTAEYRLKGTTGWSSFTGSMVWQVTGSTFTVVNSYGVGVTIGQTGQGDVPVWAQYRNVADGVWHDLVNGPMHVEPDYNGGTAEQPVQQDGYSEQFFGINTLPTGQYEVRVLTGTLVNVQQWRPSGILTVTRATRNAVRVSFETPNLSEGFYEIRVLRNSPDSNDDLVTDDVFLTDVAEIITERVRYNFTALLGVRIQLTDQLNGVPKVTAKVKGRKVNRYDYRGNFIDNVWSNNPAWISLDCLTNTRYGAGMSLSRIDLTKFVEWAAYCEGKGLKFNATLDSRMNVWDALALILRVGRAQLVPVGTKYSLAIEKPDTPSMMFGMGNIVKDTFGIEWLPMDGRANEIEVAYYDKLDGNRRKTVRVVDYDALAKGLPVIVASVDMVGVDDAAQAFKEGSLQLAINKFIQQTVSFDAPLESIGCTIGDLVYVQHDMPQWGYAGRLMPGSTATALKLDRPMKIEATLPYVALVHQSALKRFTGNIQSVVGYSLFMVLPDDLQRVRRLKDQAGNDYEVQNIIPGSPFSEIIVDRTGLTAGQTVNLWDTDVIEERSVVDMVPGEYTEITLTDALSSAPTSYSNFMFGEQTKVKKPFRVMSIDGSDDYVRSLRLLEYNETVYEDPENAEATPNYSALRPQIGQVEILGVDEKLVFVGNAVRTRVTLSWLPPNSETYDSAQVYAKVNDGAFEPVAMVTSRGKSFSTEQFADGDEIVFKVVAVDGAGGRASFNNAPTITHTVIGKLAPPAEVQGFAVQRVYGGLRFTWTPNEEPDILGYEIRQGNSWDGAEIVVKDYAGTSFLWDKPQSGTYTWLIRAIDTGRRYSESVATFSMTVIGPSTVSGFDSIQNRNMILFSWNQNPEPDIIGYELREGLNWATSSFIAIVNGTRHQVPSNIPADRRFWIKAIDSARLYSDFGAGILTKFVPEEDYNVLVTKDDKVLGWPGKKINVSVTGSDLALDSGKSYGEYIHDIDIGATRYGRNVVGFTMDATGASISWSAATFAWNSPQANQPWTTTGDIDNVSLRQLISYYQGLVVGDVEGFSLSSTLAGIGGTAAAESVGVSYANARFRQGLLIGDTTTVSWNVAIPSTFKETFWFIPQTVGSDARIMTLIGAGGSIWLSYVAATDTFVLRGTDGVVINVPFQAAVDDYLLFAVVQTTTERKLFVGRMGDSAVGSGSAAATPVGSFTSLNLY